jgi:hypothetical protein
MGAVHGLGVSSTGSKALDCRNSFAMTCRMLECWTLLAMTAIYALLLARLGWLYEGKCHAFFDVCPCQK